MKLEARLKGFVSLSPVRRNSSFPSAAPLLCPLSPASAEGQQGRAHRAVLLLRNQRLQPLFLTAAYYQVTVASCAAALCGAAHRGVMLYTLECTQLRPPAVDLWCISWPGPLGLLLSDCHQIWVSENRPCDRHF